MGKLWIDQVWLDIVITVTLFLYQQARRNPYDLAEYVSSSAACEQSGNLSKALYMNKKIPISRDLSPTLISNNTLK